jgi:hypothetical protein
MIKMVLLHSMSKYGSKAFSLLICMVNLPKSVHTMGYIGVHVDPVCLIFPSSGCIMTCLSSAILIKQVLPFVVER